MLSEEEEEREAQTRVRLRELETKFRGLESRRRTLIDEMRRLSAEQKALYDRRQAPQEEVERLYAEHHRLGGQLGEIRTTLDKARRHLDAAVIGYRELRATFPPTDRLRPEQLKKEIAELEHRQQTSALSLEDENALIARLRERTQALKEAEARTAVVVEHERQRKEAEARVAACRAEVDRLVRLLDETRSGRDAAMAQVRAKLQEAGSVVAALRAKGKERAAAMDQIDRLSQEMAGVDREAGQLIAESRHRREEARRTLRVYSRAANRPTAENLASVADAQFEELLKRGKITLGG
jgi:uncharacterized coiled-coil DUF342 family protein